MPLHHARCVHGGASLTARPAGAIDDIRTVPKDSVFARPATSPPNQTKVVIADCVETRHRRRTRNALHHRRYVCCLARLWTGLRRGRAYRADPGRKRWDGLIVLLIAAGKKHPIGLHPFDQHHAGLLRFSGNSLHRYRFIPSIWNPFLCFRYCTLTCG